MHQSIVVMHGQRLQLILTSVLLLLGSSAGGLQFGLRLGQLVPEPVRGSSSHCISQLRRYREAVEQLEPWALKMLDADAKVPSGLLRANVDQFGDYDLCLSVRSPDEEPIKGKFCLPEVELRPSQSAGPEVQHLLDLAQAGRHIRGNLTDPQFYIPASNIFLVGVCLPHGCEEQDAVGAVKQRLQAALADAPVDADIILRHGLCTEEKPLEFSPEAIFAICLLVVPTLLSLWCWMREEALEAAAPKSTLHRWLLSFSLGRNWRLLTAPPPEAPLGCLRGLRILFVVLLYALHKAAGAAMAPLANRVDALAIMGHRWTLVLRVFWTYVDGLLFISAISSAYSVAGRLKAGRPLNPPFEFFKRYIRLVVPLVLVAFVFTHLAPLILDGPVWLRYMQHLVKNCQGSIWTLVTLTSSSFGFPDNCYDTSNHLITDLLLFLLVVPLVAALWSRPSRSVNTIILMGTLITYYKFHVLQLYSVPPIGHNNFDRKKAVLLANHLLFPAVMRVPIYAVGIAVGCLLQKIDCKSHLDKRLFWLGNILAGLAATYCLCWHYEVTEPGYVFKPEKTLVYGMLHPFLWGIALGWFVFICATGQAERLNWLFSHWTLGVAGRLTLAFNLVQLPVIGYWLSSLRVPIHFSFISLINLHELLVCILLGLFVTLVYIVPIGVMWAQFVEPPTKTEKTM